MDCFCTQFVMGPKQEIRMSRRLARLDRTGGNLYKGLDYLEFGILNIPYFVGTYVQTTLPTLLVFDSAHYFKIKASRNKSTLTSSIYVPIRFYFKTI